MRGAARAGVCLMDMLSHKMSKAKGTALRVRVFNAIVCVPNE